MAVNATQVGGNPTFTRSRLTRVAMGASGTISAGDLVWVDASFLAESLATSGTSNANAASFIGVSIDKTPIDITSGATETPNPNEIAVVTEGDFVFKTTAAQTFNPFSAVYLGADAQTVSTTVLGTSIGTVSPDQRPAGGTLGGAVTGAVGTNVVVHIIPAKS